jgi:glucose/arabinose dehydrogenase
MRPRTLLAALAAVVLTAVPATAAPRFRIVRVHALDGVSQPVHLAAPTGSQRLFVVERTGRVRMLYRHRLGTFLDLRSRVASGGGEQGLLSIAFSPGYVHDHLFYVYYTARPSGTITIARYRSNGNHAIVSSRRVLLQVPHDQAQNHNGGQLAFGPDGHLWAGTGDGGGANDGFHHSQDPASRLGKLLEINTTTGAVAQRARGLRNPWRFSFDAAGTLWIGDVGQDAWEEIDHVNPASLGTMNFGWPRFEGRSLHDAGATLTGGTEVKPLTVLAHPGSEAIIGGFVYRGAVRSLRGWYLYADDVVPWLRGIKLRPGHAPLTFKRNGIPGPATSFGEDGAHRLYLVTYNGIYRFAA